MGPATGYFYGGLSGRAWRGIAIRTVALGGGLLGAMATCGMDCPADSDAAQIGAALAIGGIAVSLVSVIADISAVKGAVAAHNADQEHSRWGVEPTWLASEQVPGMVLRFRF